MPDPTAPPSRKKLGVIIPTVNSVSEPEFNTMRPEGVTVHFTRMPIHRHPQEDGYRSLMTDLRVRLDELKTLGADMVAYNCTVGSMACPEDKLIGELEDYTHKPGVATAWAVLDALKALGVRKIAMATPYPDAVNQHEKEFLAEHGITVVKMAGMTFDVPEEERGRRFAEVPSEKAYAHALSVDDPEAEALFLSCANFPTANLVDRLERETGKPVITSNVACFWAALRKSGIADPIEGFGTLFRDH